jgi:peroxiredoxin
MSAMKNTVRGHAFRLALLVTFAAALVACGEDEGGKPASSASDKGSLVGNPAPEFSVKTLANSNKGSVSLKSLRGKVVLVDFWGTFCEPCKKSFPKLQDLNTKYGTSGFQIVGISEDEADDKDKIPGFADTYGAKFALGWDEDKSIARAYKPETMPSSFLIDRKGIVRFAHVGYHDGEEVEVEKEIQQLLKQ